METSKGYTPGLSDKLILKFIPKCKVLKIVRTVLKMKNKPAAAAKSLPSCPTLCDPIDGSPPGSPSLGFSRQEHWSGLPFLSPMHESEK